MPDEIRAMIGRGSLKNFPHYCTVGQNLPTIFDLNPKQTHLLANLSCWNVIANGDEFLSMSRGG